LPTPATTATKAVAAAAAETITQGPLSFFPPFFRSVGRLGRLGWLGWLGWSDLTLNSAQLAVQQFHFNMLLTEPELSALVHTVPVPQPTDLGSL